MNLYFLVEGRHSEPIIYPRWISHLLPQFRQVRQPPQATTNSFYVFSGEGYPQLLGESLVDSIGDVATNGNFRFLVVVLDADEAEVEARRLEVLEAVAGIREVRLPPTCELKIIVQNRCIETWLLGHRRMLTRAPHPRLSEFIRHYDVSLNDPELMPLHPDFKFHSRFHEKYVEEMFEGKFGRSGRYSKQFPRQAENADYLDALIERTRDEPAHLRTFQTLIEFCRYVGSFTGAG